MLKNSILLNSFDLPGLSYFQDLHSKAKVGTWSPSDFGKPFEPSWNSKSLYESPVVSTRRIVISNLINKRDGSLILVLTASRPNHTSYKKVYFNEFVKKYWSCDMGMIIFDLHGTLTQHSVHSTVPVLLTKRNKKYSKCSPINKWDQL